MPPSPSCRALSNLRAFARDTFAVRRQMAARNADDDPVEATRTQRMRRGHRRDATASRATRMPSIMTLEPRRLKIGIRTVLLMVLALPNDSGNDLAAVARDVHGVRLVKSAPIDAAPELAAGSKRHASADEQKRETQDASQQRRCAKGDSERQQQLVRRGEPEGSDNRSSGRVLENTVRIHKNSKKRQDGADAHDFRKRRQNHENNQ